MDNASDIGLAKNLLQWLCDRCDKGTARSITTYSAYKAFLAGDNDLAIEIMVKSKEREGLL